MKVFRQSPLDPDFVQNPYPTYKAMREVGEFVYWEDYNLTVATTHATVDEVLRHRSLGRAPVEPTKPREELAPFYALEANSLLELEPPDHTRLRRLVLSRFTSGRAIVMAPSISQISDTLIHDMPLDRPVDVIETLCRPLPVMVICRLLGVPEDMRDQFLAWSNDMVAMYQARRDPAIEDKAAKASLEFTEYLRTFVEEKRHSPADDLISELLCAEEDGDKLSIDELIATCVLLLNAGHEATVHSLGNAIRLLIERPDRHDLIRPENIQGTVEECLRFDPPLHLFRRYVYADVEICGHAFRKGTEIGCLLASASRDDAVWPDGEVFDPFRAMRPHLAFGAGIHFCLGAPLARLEMQIALPLLFSQCKSLKLVEAPRVADLYHFRGLERLMVHC